MFFPLHNEIVGVDFLVVKVQRPSPALTETFCWFVEPPDDISDTMWYIDSSMLHREVYGLRSTGFGIVVVSNPLVSLAWGGADRPPPPRPGPCKLRLPSAYMATS